jgi:hypothetical protein
VDEDHYHRVEKGETWWGIAKEYGIPMVALLTMNNATDKDTLVAGRLLRERRDRPKPAPKPEPTPEVKSNGFLSWLWSLIWK